MDKDFSKPISKCSGLPIVVKLRQLLQHNRQHFLNQVGGVGVLNVILF